MGRIEVVRGDITVQEVDAIINAANSALAGGGGVDGAIHRAAGPELLAACRRIGGCPTGDARITPGFNLPARHVIHTVGPIWRGGGKGEAAHLASCYRSSLACAREADCRVVACPAISCGVYGYPLEEAARVSIEAVRADQTSFDTPQLVRWVMFDEAAYGVWMKVIGGK